MLVSSVEEIQKLLPIGAGNDYNRVKPHLTNSETAYIKPLLGTEMYDELCEFYESYPYDSPTDVQVIVEQLLLKIQHSIVHLAYYIGFDFLNASVSDMGFSRVESTTTKSLFKYQEDHLRDYFKSSGFNMLDEALLYMEENIGSFTEWSASSTYTVFKSAFIPTASAFNAIYFINKSRLTFLRLQTHIKFVEETVIKPLLGVTTYDEIKTDMTESSIPAKTVAVLPYIRTPLAYLAVALLMEESGADLSDKGLYFESTIANSPDNRNIAPATSERIAMLAARARTQGNSYLEMLKTYMADNIADWTSFTDVSGYILNRDNTDKKTFWA